MLIPQIDISFWYREGNCVANYLAKAGASRSHCIYSSMAGLPREVFGSIHTNMWGLSQLRHNS